MIDMAEKENEPIVEVRKNGKTIMLNKMPDGLYYVWVDEEMKHPRCSPEDAMRALATYIHDDS